MSFTFFFKGYLSLCNVSCENYTIMEGEDIYLECGIIRLDVGMWKKDNEILLVGESIYRPSIGLAIWQNFTLHLTGVTLVNEGYYECMEDRNVKKSYDVFIYSK